MRTLPRLDGVIPIVATPFNDDESLDLPSLDRMIRFFGAMGCNGVTLLGVLGESNRLTDAERRALVQTAVAAAGTMPVIVGCSHSGTAATVALCDEAANQGARAVMIAPSKQPVPSDESVFTYYSRIAEKIRLPIVLQDHPASTEVHMPVPLILRIAREVPAIVAVKAEAVPSPPKIAALRPALAAERNIPILTGLGGLYGLFDLERGSDGYNTGFAFPEILIAIVNAFRAENVDTAWEIYRRYLPLIVYEQQPGLAIRKEILRRRGLIDSARVRHPGATIDAATALQLSALLDRTFPGQDITAELTFSKLN